MTKCLRNQACRGKNQVIRIYKSKKSEFFTYCSCRNLRVHCYPHKLAKSAAIKGTVPILFQNLLNFFSCLSAICTLEKHFMLCMLSFPWCRLMSINAMAAHSVQCLTSPLTEICGKVKLGALSVLLASRPLVMTVHSGVPQTIFYRLCTAVLLIYVVYGGDWQEIDRKDWTDKKWMAAAEPTQK